MNPKFFWVITVLLLFSIPSANAQQPKKVPRIGVIYGGSASANTGRHDAFRQGLRELGYVEGKNIVVEWRYADGKLDRVTELVVELVRLKVDVVVSAGPVATCSTKEATATIPIVMAQDPDPVGNGFVASLAHPGGNITGLSAVAPELSGKRLEILREVVPKLSRVAVLGIVTGPSISPHLSELESTAKAFKVQLQYLDVQDRKDIETAFRAASKERADAIITLGGGILVLSEHRL